MPILRSPALANPIRGGGTAAIRDGMAEVTGDHSESDRERACGQGMGRERGEGDGECRGKVDAGDWMWKGRGSRHGR